MFDVSVKTHFSAGHHLRDYPGNCERPHGHNWEVVVTVRAKTLDHLGMGIDFREIKADLQDVIAELDHCDLNEHPKFLTRNPSSENLALHIYEQLRAKIGSDRYQVHKVKVSETPSSWVTYRAD